MALAATTAPLTIYQGGPSVHIEGIASAALSPGHLLEHHSSTGEKVRKFAAGAGKGGLTLVAVEDALQGKTIADAYALDDRVPCKVLGPGARAFLFLSATENVVIGDKLIASGTAGELKKITGTIEKVFAVALEAKNLSASGAVAAKLQVMIV